MSYILILIFSLLAMVVAVRLSYVHGMNKGAAFVEAKWEKLKKKPIAGQRVQVPGFGDVMILGLGRDNDIELIDYIPLDVLGDRYPSDLEEDELNYNTISCPLDSFIAQCELSIKYL